MLVFLPILKVVTTVNSVITSAFSSILFNSINTITLIVNI